MCSRAPSIQPAHLYVARHLQARQTKPPRCVESSSTSRWEKAASAESIRGCALKQLDKRFSEHRGHMGVNSGAGPKIDMSLLSFAACMYRATIPLPSSDNLDNITIIRSGANYALQAGPKGTVYGITVGVTYNLVARLSTCTHSGHNVVEKHFVSQHGRF